MIRFAQVVAVNPRTHRLDLVDVDTQQPIGGALFLSADGSTDGGSWNIPSVPKPSSAGSAGGINQTGRTIIAAYQWGAAGRAVVLGFARASGSQLVFEQDDRTITRHAASGTYTTVAPDGSYEVWHPSGTFFRIGTGGHEDLAPLAADQNWTVPDGAKEPTVTLSTPNASITIAPGGNATMTFASLKITSPVEIDGALTVKSTVTATGDVKAGGISLQQHKHGGVQSGNSTTGVPQ
jgi:phage baseplate assembly protein gpV